MKPTWKEISEDPISRNQWGWVQGNTFESMDWKLSKCKSFVAYENGQVGRSQSWQRKHVEGLLGAYPRHHMHHMI